MERVNIDINIAGQEEGKYRKFYLVLGICGLVWITLTLVFPDFGLSPFYFSWIVFLPGFIEAILYGLGKKRVFVDNSPYLKIYEDRIEKSKGGLFVKPDISYWTDIKLFELQLMTNDNEIKKVDLTNLTDYNLKIVKAFVTTVKKNRGL